MTDDLVKRLREYVIHMDAWGQEANHDADIVEEAADRIEQLEIEKNRSYRNLTHAMKHIEKLEAALREMMDTYPYNPPCHNWEQQIRAHNIARKALEGKDD